MSSDLSLEPSWLQQLSEEFEQPYMQELQHFLARRSDAGVDIYPPAALRYNAFNSTPFDRVRVVVLGQDPYHRPGQAQGLCFSVAKGVKIPPSLVNIFKELERDLALTRPSHGSLQSWAEQGVLLLNAILTVEQGQAGCHQKKGWERFTDAVIERLNSQRTGVIFVLWGSYAQHKGRLIDREKHRVLVAPHPSPLSAYRGFLGCGHFSTINRLLLEQGHEPIDWQVH